MKIHYSRKKLEKLLMFSFSMSDCNEFKKIHKYRRKYYRFTTQIYSIINGIEVIINNKIGIFGSSRIIDRHWNTKQKWYRLQKIYKQIKLSLNDINRIINRSRFLRDSPGHGVIPDYIEEFENYFN